MQIEEMDYVQLNQYPPRGKTTKQNKKKMAKLMTTKSIKCIVAMDTGCTASNSKKVWVSRVTHSNNGLNSGTRTLAVVCCNNELSSSLGLS